MRNIISFFVTLLFISCSAIDSQRVAGNYFQALDALGGYFYGYKDYPLSRDLINNIPYASIKLNIGKGPSGLLILESINDLSYIYVSADGVRFVIRNGSISRTHGLDNNLVSRIEPKDVLKNFVKSGLNQQSHFIYHSYDEPKLIDLKIKVDLTRRGYEEIEILSKKYNLLKVEETLENEYLGWKKTNFYYLSSEDFFVWKSKQYISPLLPAINYEVTKKPSL